jgi:hypothetical protein
MRGCTPTRRPGSFRLVVFVVVSLLAGQVTAQSQNYDPKYDPQAQQQTGPQAPGLGALMQGAVPQSPDQPAAQLGALAGTELKRQGDINDAAGNLLSAVMGGDGPELKIHRVLVLEDTERRLVLRVTTENAAHASIYGRVRNHQAQFQDQVVGYRYQLAPTSNDIDVSFQLADDVAQGATLESASLVLYLVRAGGSFARPDVVRTYLLPKRWESTIRPDNVVVPVYFQPVGEVAQGTTPPAQSYTTPAPGPATMPVYDMAYASRGDDAPVAQDQEILWLGEEPPQPQVTTRQAMISASALSRVQLFQAQPLKPIVAQIYRMPQTVTDRRGKGPGTQKLDLLTQIYIPDSVRLELKDVTSIHSWVFEDQNPASNLYYYAPRSYHLAWDPSQGHQFRMIYQAAREAGQAGGVVMSARLRTGVDNADVQLMQELLRADRRNPAAVLMPLPPAGPPAVSIADELTSLYSIPANQVTIQAGSESNDDVEVSWVTDPLTKENLQVALLEDRGLSGNVSYKVQGEVVGGVGTTLRIAVADPRTFGRIQWVRGQHWRNATPYPVRLKYMHSLMIRQGRPVVYSWSLGNAVVPPRATAHYDDRMVGSWVDAQQLRSWLEYSVDGACAACDEQVIAAITGGVAGVSASQVTFKTIEPLEETGAVEVTLLVRTRYLHPSDRALGTMPLLVLDRDRAEYVAPAPIYLAGRQPGESRPGDPLFEYQLSVTMKDGQIHQANNWIPSDHLRVVIGSHQLRQALGFLPGQAQAGTPAP